MKIKFLLVALLISFVTFGAVQAQDTNSAFKPFNISSKNDKFFAFVGVFEGDYRILSDKIELNVRAANILLRDNARYKGRRKLSELRVGLATVLESGRWNIVYKSELFKIDKIMNPNQDLSLSDLQFTIPKKTSIDLSKYWLVFEMSEYELDSGEQKAKIEGTTYAHSNRNIFGGEKTVAGLNEDCVSYDAASLQIVNRGEKGWQLMDGKLRYLHVLDNETDAKATLALAKRYSQQCFIGRDNKRADRKTYIVSYWK